MPEERGQAILQAAYPGDSDEERYCRQVLAYLMAEVGQRPVEIGRLVARLEAELQEELACGCAPLLPD
jgi:hypothetical protein